MAAFPAEGDWVQDKTAEALAQSSFAGGPASPGRRKAPKKLHAYFVTFTALFVVFVLAGFSRTFFIPVVRGTFSRPVIVHIHGMLFFAWTLLLFVQATLAATGRLRLHRNVGSFAAWLVIPMLVLGTVVASRDTVHDFHTGDGEAALSFYYGELADLAMFGLLAGAAMLLRKKPEFHKRLVIMGSLGLLGAALGRIPEVKGYVALIVYGLMASVALYDLASRRSVHAATLVGFGVLLALGLTEELIGNTRAWINTAHHLLDV